MDLLNDKNALKTEEEIAAMPNEASFLLEADAQAILESDLGLDDSLNALAQSYGSSSWDDEDKATALTLDYTDKIRKKYKDLNPVELNHMTAQEYDDTLNVMPVSLDEIQGVGEDEESTRIDQINKWEDANRAALENVRDPDYLVRYDKLNSQLTQTAQRERRKAMGMSEGWGETLAASFADGGLGFLLPADTRRDLQNHIQESDGFTDNLAIGAASVGGQITGMVGTSAVGAGAAVLLGLSAPAVLVAGSIAGLTYLTAQGVRSVYDVYSKSIERTREESTALKAASIEAVSQTAQIAAGTKVFGSAIKAVGAKVSGKVAAKAGISVTGAVALEGGTEGVGQVASNIAENVGYQDETFKDVGRGVPESIILGAGAGGFAGTIESISNQSNKFTPEPADPLPPPDEQITGNIIVDDLDTPTVEPVEPEEGFTIEEELLTELDAAELDQPPIPDVDIEPAIDEEVATAEADYEAYQAEINLEQDIEDAELQSLRNKVAKAQENLDAHINSEPEVTSDTPTVEPVEQEVTSEEPLDPKQAIRKARDDAKADIAAKAKAELASIRKQKEEQRLRDKLAKEQAKLEAREAKAAEARLAFDEKQKKLAEKAEKKEAARLKQEELHREKQAAKAEKAKTKVKKKVPKVNTDSIFATTENGSYAVNEDGNNQFIRKDKKIQQAHDASFIVNKEVATKLYYASKWHGNIGESPKIFMENGKAYIKSKFLDSDLKPTTQPTGNEKVEIPTEQSAATGLHILEVNRPRQKPDGSFTYRSFLSKPIKETIEPGAAKERETAKKFRQDPNLTESVRRRYGTETEAYDLYYPDTNKAQLDRALEFLNGENVGVGRAAEYLLSKPVDYKFSADEVALSRVLLTGLNSSVKEATDKGDFGTAYKAGNLHKALADKLISSNTEVARSLQANQSPFNRLLDIERTANNESKQEVARKNGLTLDQLEQTLSSFDKLETQLDLLNQKIALAEGEIDVQAEPHTIGNSFNADLDYLSAKEQATYKALKAEYDQVLKDGLAQGLIKKGDIICPV